MECIKTKMKTIEFKLHFRDYSKDFETFTKLFSWPEAGNEYHQRMYAKYFALHFGAYKLEEL